MIEPDPNGAVPPTDNAGGDPPSSNHQGAGPDSTGTPPDPHPGPDLTGNPPDRRPAATSPDGRTPGDLSPDGRTPGDLSPDGRTPGDLSPDGRGAMPPRDFADAAPGLLDRVLGELRHQTRKLLSLGDDGADETEPGGFFDLDGIDPHAPGAFGLLGADPNSPSDGATPGTDQAGGARTPLALVSGGTGPAPGAPAPSTRGVPARPGPPTTEAGTPVVAAAAGDPAEPDPEPEPRSIDDLLAELDGLVGLTSVKEEIHRQSAILKVQAKRAEAGLKDPTITRHLVFVGNPGTGKTTVARLVGGIYRALGLLSKGQLVEVDRSELVAGYLGQTAIKTAEVAQRALGGVLFIDEAYSLAGDQYGEEAINTLVKEMEDNRGDLVVIVAGYTGPMETFIAENPGLASRFRTTIEFADYSDDELVGILKSMAAAADYDVPDGTVKAFRVALAAQARDDTFGNGRFVRNTFEAAIGRQAWRLRDVDAPTVEQLRELKPEDIAPASDAPPVDWPAPGGGEPGGDAAQDTDIVTGDRPGPARPGAPTVAGPPTPTPSPTGQAA